MSSLGRGLLEPARKRRLVQVVKLGPMHHSVDLQREVHLRFGFHQSYWNRPEKCLFGAV